MSAPVSRRYLIGTLASAAAAGSVQASDKPKSIVLDDASGLSATEVKRHWRPAAREAQLHDKLRRELRAAASEGRPVCVGGARHSMGGQSLAPDGIALTFDRGWFEADARASVYRASAGLRWRDLVPALDGIGFAPKVTQANNDFTLGGAFSVNVHGWAAPLPPMGGTVRAATLMLANGEIVRCSPTLEPQLFRCAMGGYGLFGIVLDLDVDMVRNVRLAPSTRRLSASRFGPEFSKALKDPAVRMAYGRLSVHSDDFLQDAFMVLYKEAGGEPEPLKPYKPDAVQAVTRQLYRAQTGSDLWKKMRWAAETKLARRLDKSVSRNALLNTPVSALSSNDLSRTDILHEYFLPPDQLGAFLGACREIIPLSGADLLNVTLRYVGADRQSTMAFAPADRVAAVMSFSQARSPSADSRMRPITQSLIAAALRHGGSFYLPYRLHARPGQVERAYPRLSEFIGYKRQVDRGTLFRNRMWDVYFATRKA